ncbi:MAG: ATP-grasp fold amidoligase family protein [Candidatus Limivicinus sp.]|jgi:hypothetical protein
MLASNNWVAPVDYKVYCFNGEAKFILICVGREKDARPIYLYYDTSWRPLRYGKDSASSLYSKIKKPNCLDEIVKYANILAKPFPIVRVDFYYVDDKIYFGELTFTPAAGLDTDFSRETDLMLGDMINLYYGLDK